MERRKRRPTRFNRNRQEEHREEIQMEPKPMYLEIELLQVKEEKEKRTLYYHYCKKYVSKMTLKITTDNDETCRFCGLKPKAL